MSNVLKRIKCKGCGITKSLNEMHRIKQGKYIFYTHCKKCHNEYHRILRRTTWREKSIESCRRYYLKNKKRILKRQRKAKVLTLQTKAGRKKDKAHQYIAYQKRMGKLIPQPCELCRNPKTEAHHDNYDKPKEIRWLCVDCHKQVHWI